MNVFGLFLGAVLIEAVVKVADNIKERQFDWRWILAIVVGIVVSVFYGLDLFEAVGLVGQWSWVSYAGMVLTGIILSRGANYLADILGLINTFRRKMP